MRLLFSVVFLSFLCFFLSAKEQKDPLVDFNAVYQDQNQVFNDTQVRGSLVEESLKAAQLPLKTLLPQMDNLLFKMKGRLEPSLDIQRQTKLLRYYQEELSQSINAIHLAFEQIKNDAEDVCKATEKWKSNGETEEKRVALLQVSRATFQTTMLELEEIQKRLQTAAKSQNKITGLRDLVDAFSNSLDDLVLEVNYLSNPIEGVRVRWEEAKSQEHIVPLRLSTLNALRQRAEALIEKIEEAAFSKEEVAVAVKQFELMKSHYNIIEELSQNITLRSNEIKNGLGHFENSAKLFKENLIQIITPFQNGVAQHLVEATHAAEIRLVEANGMKEKALEEARRLRLCLEYAEVESDLVVVPQINGQPYESVIITLQKSNLNASRRKNEPALRRELAGTVYDQMPEPGQKILAGSIVEFGVYTDYTPTVPNVVGKPLKQASEEIFQQGLQVTLTEGIAAADKESEGHVYSQFPRAYASLEDNGVVELVYYAQAKASENQEVYSETPFYVLCRLYVPRLKPNAPSKKNLTIHDVNFTPRNAPFVLAIQEEALRKYSISFFEKGKALSFYVQIIGRDLETAELYQYDGALLLEIEHVYDQVEDLKLAENQASDLSEQDPLSFVELRQADGRFDGHSVHSTVQLSWKGGPLIIGWPPQAKEKSFSFFRQLL